MTTATTQIAGQDVAVKQLFVRNAHLARAYLTKYGVATNDYAAWSDAASVQVALCTDREGDLPITALGPFAMAAVDAVLYPGWFFYVFSAALTALLDTDTYRTLTIYQRVTAGAAGELKVVTPFVVTEPRFAAAG